MGSKIRKRKNSLTKKDIVNALNGNRDILSRYEVKKIGIFGSFANDKPGRKSDIDFFVDFIEPSVKNFMGLSLFLQKLFGRKVEILTPPEEMVIAKGLQSFLELELRNLSVEIAKIGLKYKVDSFDNLWKKIEKREISESECFSDLTKLEYLELEREKVKKLIRKVNNETG